MLDNLLTTDNHPRRGSGTTESVRRVCYPSYYTGYGKPFATANGRYISGYQLDF